MNALEMKEYLSGFPEEQLRHMSVVLKVSEDRFTTRTAKATSMGAEFSYQGNKEAQSATFVLEGYRE